MIDAGGAESVGASEGPLLLKHTSVVKPLVEHTTSRQSVAADEEEYQSSTSSGPSRPNSTGSNAGLLKDNRKYSTPPTSPPLRASDPVRRGVQPVQPPMAQSRGSPGPVFAPNVKFDDRQIRRKPVNGSPSGSPQRTSYPPPRTSINRSPPSPDADDTPYIRFALDQLTRDEEVRGSRRYPTHDRWSTAPPYTAIGQAVSPESRSVPGPNTYPIPRPYGTPRAQQIPSQVTTSSSYYEPQPQSIHGPQSTDPRSVGAPAPGQSDSGYHTPPSEPTATYRITPVQSRAEQARDPALMSQPDVFVPYDSEVPSLRFLPAILRPLWLFVYVVLCLLMLVAMAFSGIWSSLHNGLYDYTTFGGSRYFVFQYLPSICGMVLLLWLFQIQIAVQRVAPFIAMASFDYRARSEGPLMEFQPTNFLLPKLFYFRAGQPIVGISMIVFWLQIFTIPLLACVYNVSYYYNRPAAGWRWMSVQGIVWTLFALYFLLIVVLVVLGFWLWSQRTGLKWDPRSLADIIALLDRSNVTKDYEGSETFTSSKDFRSRLAMRSDRLGYWTTSHRPNEVFYGIGEEGANTRRYSVEAGRLREKDPAEGISGFYPDTPTTPGAPVDLEDRDEFDQIRYNYIPWYLRTTFVLLWIAAALILYIAFLAISYVNNAVLHGFSPLVAVRANSAGFSSTNFLYSFVPSVIAQIIFLSWLSVDYAFRRLQPYAAMSDYKNSGASASSALLLDYPFRLPFSVTVAALLSKDLRVAWFSFLSLIVACVPIFAGGCFWAQWYVPTQQVRVAVNPSAYYAMCVFLALFAFSLPLMIFGLRQRRLPHSCTTLAEQISFLYASQILGEREWRAPLGSKTEMTTRLLTAATSQERAMQGGRFLFGRFIGKDGRTHLGIERVGRDGSKRNWRARDTSGILTQPPPAARPAPRFRRTPGGTVVAAGSRADDGEGFPTLPVAGAAVGGAAVAGAAGAYAYDYGSKQDLINESEKAEYVRRKEGGPFGSPKIPFSAAGTTARTGPSAAPAPRLVTPVTPVSPVEDDADDEDEGDDQIETVPASRRYDYGSKQDLIAESDKAEYIRQREGGEFGSRPTSSTYPSGTTAAAAGTGAAAVAGAGAASAAYLSSSRERHAAQQQIGVSGVSTTPYPSGTSTTQGVGYPSGSSSYPTPDPSAQPYTSSNAPQPSATQPYGAAYGSVRDLTASEQAEAVRQREGGTFTHGRSTSSASRGQPLPDSPLVGMEGIDVGQDLPTMLRDASAGKWNFE